MPRGATPQTVLSGLKQQASKALSSLQQEIARRERELTMLKAEAARWVRALGDSGRRARGTSFRGMRREQSRIDWSQVLGELPANFTAKDIAQKTGKPMEQVYAGVSRWVKDKKIKKTKDGYQKLASGNSTRSREKGESSEERKQGQAASRKKNLAAAGA